jgi:hypothetical protein
MTNGAKSSFNPQDQEPPDLPAAGESVVRGVVRDAEVLGREADGHDHDALGIGRLGGNDADGQRADAGATRRDAGEAAVEQPGDLPQPLRRTLRELFVGDDRNPVQAPVVSEAFWRWRYGRADAVGRDLGNKATPANGATLNSDGAVDDGSGVQGAPIPSTADSP